MLNYRGVPPVVEHSYGTWHIYIIYRLKNDHFSIAMLNCQSVPPVNHGDLCLPAWITRGKWTANGLPGEGADPLPALFHGDQ